MQKNIGVYSGTFDPIHSGHIAFAQSAKSKSHLDAVIFLPEPQPRSKPTVTDLSHRIELLKRALANLPDLSVMSLPSEQFSVQQTLPELNAAFPDTTFTFLFGSDVIKTFRSGWPDLDILLRSAKLAIGMRAGDNEKEIKAIIKDLEHTYGITISYTLIHTPNTDVASSHIRKAFKDTASIHPDVTHYIKENGLYDSAPRD